MGKEIPTAPPETEPSGPAPVLGYAAHNDPGESASLTRGDIACLGLRLIGIYSFVQAIPAATAYFNYGRFDLTYVIIATVPVVLYAAAGIFLVACAASVARWLLPQTAVTVTEPPGHGPAQLQAIAFSVIGAYLFVSSAPSTGWVIVKVLLGDNRQSIQYSTRDHVVAALPQLIRYGGETLLGAWLFFGSKRLAVWWWSLRHPEFRRVECAVPSEGDSPGR